MKRPLIFGETLIDVFPDGSRNLGGASFNVAWHLKAFGLNPLLITRIGKDKHEEFILTHMKNWGMDLTGVQLDPLHPTGEVIISFDPHQEPKFKIELNQAMDFIDQDQALSLIDDGSLFYHGTFITRSQTSQKTLQGILAQKSVLRFVDLNIRPPFFDLELAQQLIWGSSYLKVNETEFETVIHKKWSDNIQKHELNQRFQVEHVFITRGDKTAFLVHKEMKVTETKPPQINHFKTSVGAGDAFSAVCILGISMNWPMDTILSRACVFASSVCRLTGAVSTDQHFYEMWREEWEILPKEPHYFSLI